GETVDSDTTEDLQAGAESLQGGAVDMTQADQASAAREGEERRRRRRGRRGGRRDREEEGVAVNQAADVAENEVMADSDRAQAGVFDTDSSNDADDSRDIAPAPVARPVETAPAPRAHEPVQVATVEPVAAAAIRVTELPEQARTAPVETKPVETAPVVAAQPEVAPTQAVQAEVEGLLVTHASHEAHVAPAAQESSAATPADIFEKPVSRPIENPFGAASKVIEQPVVANPFGDTPAARAPVVTQVAPAAVEAEPVQAAPVAVTPAPVAVAPAAPVVAQVSAVVEPEPVKTFEPVETKAVETKPVEVTAPAAAAPSAPVALKDEALKPMLDSAGLVWVNTDADKLRAAREAAAQAEAPKQVVRERKRLPPLDAEPMQQVETGKDA
ncbi:MAG: hypothetical protein WCA53_16080, partial [Caballeronia sp.]